jgi:hypothetical protein
MNYSSSCKNKITKFVFLCCASILFRIITILWTRSQPWTPEMRWNSSLLVQVFDLRRIPWKYFNAKMQNLIISIFFGDREFHFGAKFAFSNFHRNFVSPWRDLERKLWGEAEPHHVFGICTVCWLGCFALSVIFIFWVLAILNFVLKIFRFKCFLI